MRRDSFTGAVFPFECPALAVCREYGGTGPPTHAADPGRAWLSALLREATLLPLRADELSALGASDTADGIVSPRADPRQLSTCACADLECLEDAVQRERFLTLLFALARLRAVLESRAHARLVEFHARYKYLLMSYGAQHVRTLGRIVARAGSTDWAGRIAEYRAGLVHALRAPASRGSIANALTHVFGYVSAELDTESRAGFLRELERFGAGEGSAAAITASLHGLVLAAGGSAYVREQALFAPYPLSLAAPPA